MKGSLVVTVWHRCFFLSSTSQGYFKILNSNMFLLVIITKILFCWEKINKDEEDFYGKCKTFEYPFQ